MLPTICSHDIGNPTEPGDYPAGDHVFLVDPQHLDVWRERPDTVFHTILCTRLGDSRMRFALGSPMEG